MILPGRIAYARGILTNLICAKTQVQPCGIDLSLKHIRALQSPGNIDFDNSRRKISASTLVPFEVNNSKMPTSSNTTTQGDHSPVQCVHLLKGVYLVEFNELIRTPRDIMGQLFVRSSVFRSGAHIHAGVMDSGYEGVIGAMLTVENDAGLRVWKNARLAQMVFHQMSEETEAYSGRYQGSLEM